MRSLRGLRYAARLGRQLAIGDRNGRGAWHCARTRQGAAGAASLACADWCRTLMRPPVVKGRSGPVGGGGVAAVVSDALRVGHERRLTLISNRGVRSLCAVCTKHLSRLVEGGAFRTIKSPGCPTLRLETHRCPRAVPFKSRARAAVMGVYRAAHQRGWSS